MLQCTRTLAAKLLKLCYNLRPQNGRAKWTAKWCQVGPPKTGPKNWHPKRNSFSSPRRNLNIFKLWHLMQPLMSAAWKLDFLKMIQIWRGMKHWSVDVFKTSLILISSFDAHLDPFSAALCSKLIEREKTQRTKCFQRLLCLLLKLASAVDAAWSKMFNN